MQLEEAISEKFQLYRQIRFLEEERFVRAVLYNLYEDGAPTNSTGAPVSTDEPKIKTRSKLKDKYLSRKILVPT